MAMMPVQGNAIATPAAFPPSLSARLPSGTTIDIALVNNMPDGALLDTERQYRQLARYAAAAAGLHVNIALFAIDGVARSRHTQHAMGGRYGSLQDLQRGAFDAVIVTGAEPRAAILTQEPYWPALARVLDWADANTASMMLSCLAAHAAASHFDGIDRVPLTHKCSGAFDVAKLDSHPLTAGMTANWRAVHSRRNDLPEAALRAHGYAILGRAEGAGVHLFARQQRSLLVGFQGHPEYDTETLLLEYRRDVGRFLRGEQDAYPETPHAYFDDDAEQRLGAFRGVAERRRTIEVMAGFPQGLVIRSQAGTWYPASIRVFRNWLACIAARKFAPLAPAQSQLVWHGG